MFFPGLGSRALGFYDPLIMTMWDLYRDFRRVGMGLSSGCNC